MFNWRGGDVVVSLLCSFSGLHFHARVIVVYTQFSFVFMASSLRKLSSFLVMLEAHVYCHNYYNFFLERCDQNGVVISCSMLVTRVFCFFPSVFFLVGLQFICGNSKYH